MYALCFFHLIDNLLKIGLGNFHDNVGIHLDEPAVGIIGKSWIACLLGKALNCNVI